MKLQTNSRIHRQAGYSALFITLILVAASVLLLGSTLTRTTSSGRLNDRNVLFLGTEGAAEAAVEKVLSHMMVDYANYGEGQVQSNLTIYRTQLLPTSSESAYWTNFAFSDGTGNTSPAVYVARISTNSTPIYQALAEQFTGLSGYTSTYRIMANVSPISSTYHYNFTNAVQQDVQLAQIPIFQFAIFYNGLLEFSDTAPLTVNGPVHANSNIYTGVLSSSSLTFNSIVTTTGNVTSPANAGFGTNSWGGPITYNAGFQTSRPSLTLPIGTNSTSGTNVQQMLYPPNTATQSSAMISQLYYTKADLILMISNTTFTAIFKSGANDGSPATFTNYLTMLTNRSWITNAAISNVSNWGTNWGWCWDWLSTTNTFKDQRENRTMTVSQIDVSKLNIWITNWLAAACNTNVNSKFPSSAPFNIIYIADWRNPNTGSGSLSAIRLIYGSTLPTNGLTIATPNPLYIQGNYNTAGNQNLLTTNTSRCVPASVACDAITILSSNWLDSKSTLSYTNSSVANATSTTVNAAMLGGIVSSTGTSGTTYSGGANNFPRLLEDWSGSGTTLALNTSIVCLFNSTWATGQFQMPGVYYAAPASRKFSFDQNYTISTKMPPGTPNICRAQRSAWCNPTPGDTNFNYSFATDFVPN